MRLAIILKKWRTMEDIGVREAAKRVGVSAATWSRVERGYAPDGYTLAKLIGWMTEKM